MYFRGIVTYRRRLLLACPVSPYHFASSCRNLPLALLHVGLRSRRGTFPPCGAPQSMIVRGMVEALSLFEFEESSKVIHYPLTELN